MLYFASLRRLAPALALLCLPGLAPLAQAQNAPVPTVVPTAPMPTAPVQKLADQAAASEKEGRHEEALRLYDDALAQARTGKDAVGETLILRKIGNVYWSMKQFPKAQEFYEQALRIARSVGDKSDEASALYNIGNVYRETGQPQKALEVYEQALALYRTLGDKQREANTLNVIGIAYLNNNQPQKALEFYGQALTLYRTLGDKNKEASALYNIGNVYRETGQPQKALEVYEQALALYRTLGDKQREANTLNVIGIAYLNNNQPQKALEVYEQALRIARSAGDKHNEAGDLILIGSAYYNTGQPQKVLELYEQALSLYRKLGDKNGEALSIGNIGNIYAKTGQPQKVLELYEQALSLYRKLGDKNGEANTLNNSGNVYRDTNQPQKALEVYKQALSLAHSVGNKSGEIIAFDGMACAYYSIGQPQKALEVYEQARARYRTSGDKSLEAHFLVGIGSHYFDTNQPQKALEFLEQALPIVRSARDKNGETRALIAIGDTYFKTGQPQKALGFYEQELTLSHGLGDKNLEVVDLNRIGNAYSKTGQPQKALGFYEQAVAVLEELRANLGGRGEGRSAFLASSLDTYYRCLNLMCQQGHAAEAFALAQKTKARSLLDLLASSQVDLDAALTPEERQEQQTLQQQTQQINAQMLKEGVENEVGAKKRFAALQEQLKHNENSLQLLMDRLYALHPGLAEQQQAHTATLPDLAALMPSDTALLEYVQTSNKELRLFVVTTQNGKAQVHLHTLALPAAQLQRQCSAFHAACADPRRDPSVLSAALSRLLLTPAQDDLRGRTRLIVCPDGPLWDVPFAALRVPGPPAQPLTRGANAEYLWERRELSYAYSATGMQAALAARARHKPAEHASVLALANPFFGSSSRFGDIDGVPGQRPFELPSRPIELPSRPFELPSRPFELPSRPFETPSRPVELPSRQLMQALQADRGKAIRSLPGAQREAEAIRRLFPDAAIYTGKAAQESVVIREAGKYKYLHFATHGFFNDAAPLLSCIVLAQPQGADKVGNTQNTGNTQHANSVAGAKENTAAAVVPVAALTANAPPADTLVANAPFAAAQTQADDGLLTVRKVFGLHLNADLVTLSACNSGRGQIRTGEGIVGLTWAFFAAGCPAQVVSQWSVDDAATGQLMTTFYAGLKQGKSKSAALREAALKLSKDGKHQHPYYWTPFFLVGDWR